ncbi:hypothetical protein [Bradyrhizobium genosp. P]|uniref:hypothetical protein n=1 Tax=Bradyrhizobium genosp. P TaxID=83641 RepID=UPI003CF10BC0
MTVAKFSALKHELIGTFGTVFRLDARRRVNDMIIAPLCPKCDVLMLLAHRRPGRARFELQTFECPRCDQARIVEVADPLEKAAGWVASRELQRPE